MILGFDTSAAHCAAALLSGDRVVSSRREEMARGQGERLIPLLEEVLAEGGVALGALSALAVGIGPGNFTGIRISVSAARGLALALGVPAVGVSAFEMHDPGAASGQAARLICLPAVRGQAFVQRFAGSEPAGAPRQLDPEAPDLSPEERTCHAMGPGAHLLRAAMAVGAEGAPEAPEITLVRVAARRLATGQPVPRPAPLYVRAPDAAPSRIEAPVILP